MPNTSTMVTPSVLLLVLLCPTATASEETQLHTQDWLYADVLNRGPSNWGDIQKNGETAYPACKPASKEQSPINIASASTVDFVHKLEYNYHTATFFDVENNQHTVKVSFHHSPGYATTASLGGKKFELTQLHFHSPSEHMLAGTLYPMEMHLVHQAAVDSKQPASAAPYSKYKYLVIGVMFEDGPAHNQWLNRFWSYIPGIPLGSHDHYQNSSREFESTMFRGVTGKMDIKAILPGFGSYFTYDGSFTTPPCTEGVKWYVMENPVRMSTKQLEHFRSRMGFGAEIAGLQTNYSFTSDFFGNNRPTQPLNGRVVTRYNHAGEAEEEYSDDRDARTIATIGTVLGMVSCLILILNLFSVTQRTYCKKKKIVEDDPVRGADMTSLAIQSR